MQTKGSYDVDDVSDDQLLDTFGKFLTVIPSSRNDDKLLAMVLEILAQVLNLTHNQNLADFVCDAMGRETSPLHLRSFAKPEHAFMRDKRFFCWILDIFVQVIHLWSVWNFTASFDFAYQWFACDVLCANHDFSSLALRRRR